MLFLALKMLINDRAKYIGIILGISFASFIITQQAGIFVGIMKRTYGLVTDTSQPDIWVMDDKVQYIDDIKPLKETELYRIKGIEGVAWAVPFYKGMIKGRLANGTFQNCIVIGIDDSTLIGAPPIMLEGRAENLRYNDGIIVNKVGAEDKLASGDGEKIPLAMGDIIELNDRRAKVVGICEVARTFQSQPVVYTTYNRAISFAPMERKLLSFILAKAESQDKVKEVCQRIKSVTGLAAYTQEEFSKLTVDYYLKYTGIPLNFGVAVLLGLVIGTAIAGQTFYNFIVDNLRYLGIFKAMGANNLYLLKMTLFQVAWVGFIGWGIGTGAASFFGYFFKYSDLSFSLPWQLYALTAFSVFFICFFSTMISLFKIYKIEPAIVFRS